MVNQHWYKVRMHSKFMNLLLRWKIFMTYYYSSSCSSTKALSEITHICTVLIFCRWLTMLLEGHSCYSGFYYFQQSKIKYSALFLSWRQWLSLRVCSVFHWFKKRKKEMRLKYTSHPTEPVSRVRWPVLCGATLVFDPRALVYCSSTCC